MAFDLERALRKKGEVESARLDSFHFGLRARTMRLLAEQIAQEFHRDVDGAAWAKRVASQVDEEILGDLRALAGGTVDDARWTALVASARATAREQLVAERGNPAPHRLA
jgi:hypothetical protein